MAKPAPSAVAAPYYGATPITEKDLLENFDEAIDRCMAGETFIIIRDGVAVVAMVPYDEYVTLVEQARTLLAVEAERQSCLAASHASEADSLAFIADAAAEGEPT